MQEKNIKPRYEDFDQLIIGVDKIETSLVAKNWHTLSNILTRIKGFELSVVVAGLATILGDLNGGERVVAIGLILAAGVIYRFFRE